jgi:hypothetical protein
MYACVTITVDKNTFQKCYMDIQEQGLEFTEQHYLDQGKCL